ncbi:LysR family transcriptional regulator [Nonomuraea rubra]|uniref:DNA-binding transcriptional LysR family regulator n=1 Tax=Nonomuraea rubra TaxID=46180 RepID=A0A7X0NNW2_9ACTN|nr:LysR family transcriptional regulator [Nonomuraea rubra]MBB6546933.1 DNA-binding transcriptional LysR family regulator [Nonomuraea rubra]
MERHEIETFLTLAEELHFRRTAERLGLAQGRVSQIIKKLERRIGASLFDRTSRRVALTPIGQQLHDGLLPAHRQIQRVVDQARSAARGFTGPIRVGFSASWSGEAVIKAADLFQDRHPDAEVHIREVQLNDPLGPMRADEVDLQLTEFPIREPDITVGAVVFTEPRGLMVPARHPFAERLSVSVEDLTQTTLIPMTGEHIPQYWLDAMYPRRTPSGLPIPHGPGATYWQETLSLVGAGKGVSPASLRAAQYFSHPGVVMVPFHDAPPIEYGLLWRASRETARVRAFAEIIRQAAASVQPAACPPKRR